MTISVSGGPEVCQAPAVLTIAVVSPCVVGIDPGGTLTADVASVVDEYGLPYIPRNRLAARLRDAALTVLSEGGASDADVECATSLFGASAVSDRQRRALTVSHAQLPRPLQATVASAINLSENEFPSSRLLRSAVRSALTVTLSSTARDERGAPQAGTLRDVEAVIPGVVFEAALTWAPGSPTLPLTRFLARCVLALTQIGYGETDFRGRVDCALDGDRGATATLAFGDLA